MNNRQRSGGCPNHPDHPKIELAFYDEETGLYHWHCVTPLPVGGVCHAEWVTR